MSERYDIAIIGSGPAGLSAAINAKIRNKKIILFGNDELSNKLVKAPKIDNYLGLESITGNQLKERFINHINERGISIVKDRINNVYAMGNYFTLISAENTYESTAVILAGGIEFSKPLKGELEFLGKGVGYCATCDAPLYRDRTVTVIGYNKESVEESNFISEIVGKVYFVPRLEEYQNLNKDIEVVKGMPVSVEGDQFVNKLVLKDKEIATDGIFILKDSISPSQLVPGLDMDTVHIKVNRKMETNLKGLYAAGDITGKPYQFIKAAGEGQVAALNASSYLDSLK